MESIKILGVNVANTTKQEALEFIIKGLEHNGKKVKIFTPNPEIIMFAQKDERFRKILNSADLALPDGIGVLLAAKVLGKQIQKRITGVDFMEMLCSEASKRGFTVGLMGGRPKIAERTTECLLGKYPELKIAFISQEWSANGFVRRDESGISRRRPASTRGERASPEAGNQESRERKNHNSKFIIHDSIDILFVAYGFPKQERWIYENLPNIQVRVAMAVGGSFDYISGAVPRASLFLRNLGFEWLFRLMIQPCRLVRQLALLRFILLVLKTRFSPKTR